MAEHHGCRILAVVQPTVSRLENAAPERRDPAKLLLGRRKMDDFERELAFGMRDMASSSRCFNAAIPMNAALILKSSKDLPVLLRHRKGSSGLRHPAARAKVLLVND